MTVAAMLSSKKQAFQGVRPLSGIPFGGLGTGSIEIRSDGALHEWQIFNNPPLSGGVLPGAPVPPSPVRPGDSLFAIKTRQGNAPPVVRILRQRDPTEAIYTYILPYVGNVQEIRYTGEFPFAVLAGHPGRTGGELYRSGRDGCSPAGAHVSGTVHVGAPDHRC